MKLSLEPCRLGFLLIACVLLATTACIANTLGLDVTGEEPVSGTSAGAAGGGIAGSGGNTQTPTSATGDTTPQFVFEPVSTASAARRIKALTTGLGPTDAELTQATTQEGLSALLDIWLESPQSNTVLLGFFSWAFQTSQMGQYDLAGQQPSFHPPNGDQQQALKDMMPRTALNIVRTNQPFNTVATTNQFMATPGALAWLSFIDWMPVTDQGANPDLYVASNPNFGFSIVDSPNVPDSRARDASDPDFLIFTATPFQNMCTWKTVGHEIRIQATGPNDQVAPNLWSFLWQNRDYVQYFDPNRVGCQVNFSLAAHRMSTADSTTWRLVTIRPPVGPEQPINFWDFDTLKSSDTIILRTPRIGFLTDPAFLSQLPTNLNNQARVTVNQTWVVAFNKVFNGSDQTQPVSTAALPLDHAAPNTACYGCHITMDPIRQYFRQALTTGYGMQRDTNMTSMPGVWAQDGVSSIGQNIADLGQHIANSPQFSTGWVLKVCSWVNSSPCNSEDPEIARISGTFVASQFNFLAMFKEVLLSPITTFTEATATSSQQPTVFAMARRRQLCTIIGARLGIADPCGIQYSTALSVNLKNFSNLMATYPSDSYTRGTAAPTMVTLPSLPMRTSLEFACSWLAQEVIDNNAYAQYQSSDPNTALRQMASTFMGLPDSQVAPIQDLLAEHYQTVLNGNQTAQIALRSTFITACLSPHVSMLGAL